MARWGVWRRVQDAAVAALMGTLGLLEIWVPFESVQGSPAPVHGSIGVVACAILIAFRRERPVVLVGVPLVWVALAVLLGGDLPVLFFGQLVPFALTLYSAARHAAPNAAVIVCATLFATVAAADLAIPELQGPEEMIFHWSVFLIAVGIGWGLRVSERRAVDAGVRAGAAEAAGRESALRAVAEERARIARELHDILGHSVSVMVVQAGAAAKAVDDDPAFVGRALEAIRTTGTQALGEVRRVVELLRTEEESSLVPQPGLGQLPSLLDQAGADGLRIDFEQSGTPHRLSPGQELALYRVVQEALTNVRKHADAGSVRVRIEGTPQDISVTVADDGAHPVRAAAGHGLVGMHERISVYGGQLETGPDPAGTGWRVRATLPLQTIGVSVSAAVRHE